MYHHGLYYWLSFDTPLHNFTWALQGYGSCGLKIVAQITVTYNYSILLVLGSINWASQKLTTSTKIRIQHAIIKVLLQTAAYKQLHEPNAYGFCRILAMNADMHHEYTEPSYEYYNIPTLLCWGRTWSWCQYNITLQRSRALASFPEQLQ